MSSEKETILENSKRVAEAYTAQSAVFDDIQIRNPIAEWMRNQVHLHIERYVKKENRMLDINAGTGIDAVYFAQKGFSVTATDIAAGMVNEIRKKISHHHLEDQLTVFQLSYTEVEKLLPATFDVVTSNFGGLNCINDISFVAEQLKKILNPNAIVALVVMPPFCPWEILHALKGDFKTAFRRFRRFGTTAQVEGHSFTAYYHTPKKILKSFGKEFTLLKLSGVAAFTPPPYMEKFPKKFPRLLAILNTFDELFSSLSPFNRFADHIMIIMQYNP